MFVEDGSCLGTINIYFLSTSKHMLHIMIVTIGRDSSAITNSTQVQQIAHNLKVFYALLTLNKSKYFLIIITNIHAECFGTYLIF